MAVVDGRPYLVALLTIDTEGAAALAAKHGIEDTSVAAVSQHAAIRAEFQEVIDGANRNLFARREHPEVHDPARRVDARQ